jgi:hypothetical protein
VLSCSLYHYMGERVSGGILYDWKIWPNRCAGGGGRFINLKTGKAVKLEEK